MTGAAGAIGVFDSGVGGLTVLRALRSVLPQETFVYLGDSARLPYGTKSAASVVRYSLQCADALVARGIRCLVVACNTASASALDALRLRYPGIPVIGVIEPGAAAAVAVSRTRHIAVIGTEGTIGGGAYQDAIRRLDSRVRVTAQACSLFVAVAEEGWAEGAIAEAVAHRYLDPIFRGGSSRDAAGVPDTLVLGCTHFPVLVAALRAVLPDHVALVDSAATVAHAVTRELPPAANPPGRGGVIWLATDGAARFARVGGIFLGEALRPEDIEIIDL
ncbi:MAG TPA: glutamate racemase [Steroidobacteraceae bacterium]|nr:glutamate racemase [Steroidobacteraceae bacterium]